MLTDEDLKIRDHHDPNYESEEDEDVGISSACRNVYFGVSIFSIESQTLDFLCQQCLSPNIFFLISSWNVIS